MSHADTTHLSFLLRLRDRADKLSWQEFHDRYGQLLYRYARSRGANDADAEDVVQEVELGLFKAVDGLEYDARKGRFRNYLRVAVVHTLARRRDQAARQPTDVDPRTFDGVVGEDEAGVDAAWQREWAFHRLRWAMQGIAEGFEPTTLKAFEMHVLGGVSVSETAQVLGMSKASVYQAKSRILKCLKARLLAEDPEADM